jgi:hypothetical protein
VRHHVRVRQSGNLRSSLIAFQPVTHGGLAETMAWFYIIFADLFEVAWPFVLKRLAPISSWAPLFIGVVFSYATQDEQQRKRRDLVVV